MVNQSTKLRKRRQSALIADHMLKITVHSSMGEILDLGTYLTYMGRLE